MIITQKKPIDELMAMLGDAQKIAILGCGSCATACATGGEKEVAELKAYLESKGKTVVATNMADYCCMNMGVKTAMKKLNAAGPDAVVCMSCGDGVQVAAAHSPSAPVYPSNNTMWVRLSVSVSSRKPVICAETVCWEPPAVSAPFPVVQSLW